MAAREAIAHLDGIGKHLPNYALLLRPLQQREALRSSSMEGTYATPEELLLYQAEPRDPKSPTDRENDWREVYNYGTALQQGRDHLDGGLPLSLQLVRAMHASLLSGVRGDDKDPGQFRQRQVQVGAGGRFIPPPAHQLQDCLSAFERSLTEPSTIDPLIWAFMVHYQFETIHPFYDGNGRIGRLLLSLQIYQSLKLSNPWLYLSAYFERHKDEYIDGLFRVSTHNDWNRWILFCLQGATEQARDAISRSERLVALREKYRQKVAASGASARLATIIDCLFERPLVTILQLKSLTNVTYPTAKSDAGRLVRLGVLRPGPAGLRPAYFSAPEIMAAAFDEPDND